MNTSRLTVKINCNINCFKCLPRKCRISNCCDADSKIEDKEKTEVEKTDEKCQQVLKSITME